MRHTPVLLVILFGSAATTTFSQALSVPSANYPTIQSAIAAAPGGATVLVAPGVYLENIDFLGKAITVRSAGGPAVTTIDGSGSPDASTVRFSGGETWDSRLEGFTITGGTGYPTGGSNEFAGGGIVVRESNTFPTIVNNHIRDNDVSGPNRWSKGGGIALWYCGPVRIIQNIITGNTARFGGGLYVTSPTGPPLLLNNTISGNTATSYGGALACYAYAVSAMTVANSILWGNTSPTPALGTPEIALVFGGGQFALTVTHCCVQGGWSAGAQIITGNPLLAAPSTGDYRLLASSPCIDAGDASVPLLPALDFAGSIRIAGQNVDLGVHEYGSAPPGPPAVMTITPTLSSLAGGVPVTLTGSGFSNPPATTATIGGVPLSALTIVNSGTMTGTTPPLPFPQVASVVVTTPGGTATLPSAMTYDHAVLMTSPQPTQLGSPLSLRIASYSTPAGTPIIFAVDTDPGPTSLGQYGTAALGFSQNLDAVVDFFGAVTGTPDPTAVLDSAGQWEAAGAIPNWPVLIGQVWYGQAYAFTYSPLPPNLLFWISNQVAVSFAP